MQPSRILFFCPLFFWFLNAVLKKLSTPTPFALHPLPLFAFRPFLLSFFNPHHISVLRRWACGFSGCFFLFFGLWALVVFWWFRFGVVLRLVYGCLMLVLRAFGAVLSVCLRWFKVDLVNFRRFVAWGCGWSVFGL